MTNDRLYKCETCGHDSRVSIQSLQSDLAEARRQLEACDKHISNLQRDIEMHYDTIAEFRQQLAASQERERVLRYVVEQINDTTRHDHGLIPMGIRAAALRALPEGNQCPNT